MALSVSLRNGICHLRLGGQMTAGTAGEMGRHFVDAFQRYDLFELDLSGVEAIDEGGIRVLLLLKRLGGRTLSVGMPSPAVLDALNPDQLAALGASPGGRSLSLS